MLNFLFGVSATATMDRTCNMNPTYESFIATSDNLLQHMTNLLQQMTHMLDSYYNIIIQIQQMSNLLQQISQYVATDYTSV